MLYMKTHPETVMEFHAANLDGLEKSRYLVVIILRGGTSRRILSGRIVGNSRSGRVRNVRCHGAMRVAGGKLPNGANAHEPIYCFI